MKTLFNNLTHIQPREAVFAVLLGGTVLALVAYGYFICTSVVNVVLRQELVVAYTALDSHVGELEATYLYRTQEITKELASKYGLVSVDEVIFVERSDPARALTMRDAE